MEQDSLSQSPHRWAFTHLCVLPARWHDAAPACMCCLLFHVDGMSEASALASVPACWMAAACVIRTKQESMTENPSMPGL